MAKASRRPPSKSSIKAAADRAEARASGTPTENPTAQPVPVDPAIIAMTEPGTDGTRAGRKVGRIGEYSADAVPLAKEMAENGATDDEIAQALGISRRTFYRWSAAHKAFRRALRAGKSAANRRVERSLYSMAVGHKRKAVKIMQYEGNPVIVPYIDEMAPDVGAAKLWLSNRDPKRWRTDDSQVTVNASVSIDGAGDLSLARRLAFAMARSEATTIEPEPAPLLTKGALGKETDK